MQIMPQTGRRFGAVDLFDPLQNLQAGAAYLHWLMGRFDGDISLVLAAYNAGENAVIRHGHTVPPYPETRDYVDRVLARYHVDF
jgi:soluble lytic murein transglycosylase-like protein